MNEQVRHFAPAGDARASFDASDFVRIVERGAFDDMRAELVDGVIEKMMPSSMKHGESNLRFGGRIADAYHGTAYRVAIDLMVRIDDLTVRGADIAVTEAGVPDRGAVSGADIVLAVEIADTSLWRDLGKKLIDYARVGIREYWVVDLDAHVVHVMRDPAEDGYHDRSIVRFGEMLAVPATGRTVVMD